MVVFLFPLLMSFFSFLPNNGNNELRIGAHFSAERFVSYIRDNPAWRHLIRTQLLPDCGLQPNLFWVLNVKRIVWEVVSVDRCSVFCPTWQSDTRIGALADDLIGHSGLLFPSAFTRLELNSCSCYRGVAAKDDLSLSWQSKHLCSGQIYCMAALSNVFISFLFVSIKTAKKQTPILVRTLCKCCCHICLTVKDVSAGHKMPCEQTVIR